MAYEPTVWKKGDVITSAKLNKVENALSGTSKVYFADATVDEEEHATFNETYQQIADKFADGVVFARFYKSNVCIATELVTHCGPFEGMGDYIIGTLSMNGPMPYVASTPNDYPMLESQGANDPSNH